MEQTGAANDRQEPGMSGLSAAGLNRAASHVAPGAPPSPSGAALRRALVEVVKRGRLGDATSFARELHIDLSERRRGGALARGRGRAIERTALGVFGGFCLAAAASIALHSNAVEGPATARFGGLDHAAAYTGDIETANIAASPPAADALSAEAVRGLIEARPRRCAAPSAGAGATILGLEPVGGALAGGVLPGGCAEETFYDAARGVFTQRSALASGATLEINGAFRLDDGVLCHLTSGATAHVIGGRSHAAAGQVEAIVEAQLSGLQGGPVCHVFRAPRGGGALVADVFVASGGAPRRRESGPFAMRDD